MLSSVWVHVLFGGDQNDAWSLIGWAAVSEELLKLVPLALLLWGSRRGRTSGIVRLALVGAATGVGLQFVEEAVPPSDTGWLGYGTTLFGAQVIRWEFWSLSPGQFEIGLGEGLAAFLESESGGVAA